MNMIIWKGVSSTTIEGLVISELPPISKPPLRTKETTIDGRDGSISEDLGYGAYDKSITIGLRGNFDINKVIKYFTGEGEIIFSNEPDKVYTAKVIGQIGYNRLLRFRTAVVTFKVQPYKHKYNEAFKETQTEATTGTNIVLNDSANATIKSIVVGDGSKTEGQVEINIVGKNLLNIVSGRVDGFDIVNDGTKIIISGTNANSYATRLKLCDVKLFANNQYCLSGGVSTDNPLIASKTTDTFEIVSDGNVGKYTAKENATMGVYLRINPKQVLRELTIFPQLEIGTSASSYVSHQSSTAILDYTTNTLSNSLRAFEPTTIITNADDVPMTVEYFKYFEVFNEGLETSKPIMVLRGSGAVGISVNSVHIFDYTFPEGETEVVIDSEKEDAYLGSALKNRNMNGEFPILLPGTNKIEWSGYVESIEILPRSRWL